jgi:hypothetical protein
MHYNGKPMLDTAGNPIHAHGGHMLRYGEYWYWYGEDRRGDAYVSCYRSADLHSWEYRGTVLSADSPAAPMRVRSDLTLRRRSGEKALDSLRTQAELLIAPYVKDPFVFVGV